MDKAMFDELLASVQEMDEVIQGRKAPARVTKFAEPEVKVIREQTGLSQVRFAALIGVSKRTLENWEQGRRHPAGPAKALLRIVLPILNSHCERCTLSALGDTGASTFSGD